MHRMSPVVMLVVMISVSSVYAQKFSASQAKLAEYFIHVPPPPKCKPLKDTSALHTFGGEIIAAWRAETTSGPAVLYVIAGRTEGQYDLEQLADAFGTFAANAKLETERYKNFYVMNRPAIKFVLTGKGDGSMITAIAGKCKGDVDTCVEVVLTSNPWKNSRGTDMFQFVLGCPQEARKEVSVAFETIVHKASFAGTYDGDAGEQLPELEMPMPAVTPGDDTEQNYSSDPLAAVTIGAAMPQHMSGSTRGVSDMMFGTLYATGPEGPAASISTQFISPNISGETAVWRTSLADTTDVYICLWPQLRSAWVIPRDQFNTLAVTSGNMRTLRYSDELLPFLGRWDVLWAVDK